MGGRNALTPLVVLCGCVLVLCVQHAVSMRPGDGHGAGVVGRNDGNLGAGVAERNDGNLGSGVAGRNDGNLGSGVAGRNDGNLGAGVAGRNDGNLGAGVAGRNDGNLGAGVAERKDGNLGSGVAERKDGNLGAGVAGRNDGNLGSGVAERKDGNLGAGVAGRNDGNLGSGVAERKDGNLGSGVAERNDGNLGSGVAGRNDGNLGAGVAGRNDGNLGAGVAGRNDDDLGSGVAGRNDGNLGSGVAGRNDGNLGSGVAGRNDDDLGSRRNSGNLAVVGSNSTRRAPKSGRQKRSSDTDLICRTCEPECDGKTTEDGACDENYPNSHLIERSGTRRTQSHGSCPDDDSCSCPTDGFYSNGGVCSLCPDIAHCQFELCSSTRDVTCDYCEGVVLDSWGYRAYKMSSDRTQCQQACSWRSDSDRCYPGRCSNELTSSCVCTSSFSGTHCRTIDDPPDIVFNDLKVVSPNMVDVNFPLDSNAAPNATLNDVWTNHMSPGSLTYEYHSKFIRALPGFHPFIKEASVGVAGASVAFVLRNKAGTQRGSTLTRTCSGISTNNPNTNMKTCKETLQSSFFRFYLPAFQHEDRLYYTFKSIAGGYVVVEDKESGTQSTDYFVTNTQTHAFQLNFDNVVPVHCLTSCTGNMLSTLQIITTSSVTISWDGWSDAAAGMGKYGYRTYELTPVNNVLQHSSVDSHGVVVTTSGSGTTTFTLQGTPGIYAIVLDAYDRANSIKSARKLVLYDSGSRIERAPDATAPLRVTSAAAVTSWTWQQTEGDVTITWNGRYRNSFHDRNKVLNAVAAETDVESSYDDNEGNMTVTAMANVEGIVKFTTAYLIDNQGGSTLSLPPDASFTEEPKLNGTNTYAANMVDGQTLTFWVRAYDIRGIYDEESVTVHVDSSPPIIHSLWLTKDHFLNLSVHGINELSKMTIEWEAYDEHSGLKLVQWRVFDKFTGLDIVHGHQFVPNQGGLNALADCQSQYASCVRGPQCYCTGPVACFHRHFQVKPTVIDSNLNNHGGMFHDKDTNVHDYDYFLEVTVYNHANLSTTLRKQITVDLTPPEVGVVHDGIPGSPEVDYAALTSLHAHWSGFFDRESGVRSYQYAFDTSCVDASAFGHDTTDSRVRETYDTTASWTAPGDGTYKVTVVAFNSAMEESDPVCSDGVVVDTTPPAMSAFYVAGAIVAGGVVAGRSPGEVWFIGSDRRRRLVGSPDQACITAANSVSVNLDHYAISPLTSPVNATEACAHGALASKFINTFYLVRDKHLYLNWTGSDAESGIHDYEVGSATTSGASVPDISGYRSTNHHALYQQHHPNLTEGTPFYILVKAINKAGVEAVQALGPITLDRRPPTYTGTVTLALTSAHLEVTWNPSLFADVETSLLSFTVSLEDQTGGAILRPHAQPEVGGSCTAASSTPPSCAAFDLEDLHWGLHEKHVYVAKVKVTDLLGLHLQLESDPYTHDTRVPSSGIVFEIASNLEAELLGVQRSEDTDFQLSTTAVEATWSGFDDDSMAVTYRVGLGSAAGADDVSAFTSVGTAKEHTFTGLSLQVDSKYYVSVVATTTAGDVTVSSDGVTVIEADQTESGITVKDGPPCAVSGTLPMTQDHHADGVLVPCEDDASFQSSFTTMRAHWTMTSAQSYRYPDVQYKVQKQVPSTNVWHDVTNYTYSATKDGITALGLSLQGGGHNRLAVKFCVSGVCALPIYSTGVYVLLTPLVTGSLDVQHSNSTGVSLLDVTLEGFRDADITPLSEAQTAVLGYQWSLSHRRQDNSRPVITDWRDVTAPQTLNTTHVQFSIPLSGELSFHKCLEMNIRGVNKVGMVSAVSRDVLDCKAKDPLLVKPLLVMDAVGVTVGGNSSTGSPVELGINDAWLKDDDDYTPHDNYISAVWPLLRHSQVMWAVLESRGPDVMSHFLDPATQTMVDPCLSPLKIACGQANSQKYMNAEFGNNTDSKLQHGHHYYVCIFAKGENVTFEKWVEVLPDVTACTDGVTVDLTPPRGGVVSVDGLLDGLYQASLNVVSVRWSGFQDVEELGLAGHGSGILSYHVAVGSVPGGEDMVTFTDVGLVNSYTLHSLTMHDGSLNYVTVKATDHVGRSVKVSSAGFVADSTPPSRTSANFRFPEPYFTSLSVFSVCWTDMFRDAESGIERYVVSVGSRRGHDDVMSGQAVTMDCEEFHTDVTMLNGHAYYVTVVAFNGAGLRTVESSKPVVVMVTPPSAGWVFDGPPPGASATAADVDFVTSQSDVVAFWNGFSTPINPVKSYSVILGTCPGCDDVVAEFDVGPSTEVSWSHAPLRHDVRYFTTVKGCNAVGQCSRATSDGVMIDVTPPVAGAIWDGTGDEDIHFQSQRDFLGAQWRGFSDLGSGLSSFSWRAGTTAGGSDIMTERQLGLVFSAFTTSLSASLPEGPTIYITVSAVDAAGNRNEVTSNGFRVDTSAPEVGTVPELIPGVGTLDSAGAVSRDMLGVRWSLNDQESHIAAQYLSVHSHLNGEFQSASVQIPGPLTQHIFTSLALHDGSKYKVKVTACNLARLCTTTETVDILLDNTPPSTGMYAVETDHSAELGRHLDTWMQWTSNSLRMAWLGFHDYHSGIATYQVNVGTKPYASDLNVGNTPATVSHTESGTSYEDEGFVQVYEVPTKNLSASQDLFVTVWAINGVDLKSHPAMSMFRLQLGGAMFLHRRCTAFNCLSHCSCSIQGGTCGAATTCTQYTAANNPNSGLTLTDHADLSVLNSASPSADTYQASQSYLAATWRVSTLQGLAPIRYEVSMGLSDRASPMGVYNVATDRVWRDVGLDTSAVTCIPRASLLTTRVAYSTFLRAWYSDGSHTIFKSPGITPVSSVPTATNLVGRAIKEHAAPGEDKDVDFVTEADAVHISWKGKFITTSAPAIKHNVFIGTRPEAADVYSSADLSGTAKTLHVTSLSLRENTLYYSTVTSQGGSGLVKWAVSDGFLLDTIPPQAGLVMDGSGLRDVDFQPRDDVVNATWHGFYDAGSGVRNYMWCVGTASDASLCDVLAWTDVGAMTSVNVVLGTPVTHGTTLYNKVYAKDMTGHKSQVSVSDGVKVDITAPDVLSMVYTNGINMIYNPSFEADVALNANLSECDAQPPTSWQITAGSCVTLHRPEHVMSSKGVQHAVFHGTLQQTVAGLTPGAVYRLTLRLAHPHNALANQKPVTGHVTVGGADLATPFDLDPSVCRGVCDSDVELVMLWHTFSYVVTASSTTLDVSISTAVASPDQSVAVDDVILEEIRAVASGGSQQEASVTNHGVFLAEWSVLQTSWHFTDHESPIVEYQWALGTSEGGVQLQPFRSVGRRQHASLSGLSVSHGTSLHVTVLALNSAGRTSLAHALPLTVDLTPPDIVDVKDGSSGDDVDFQTSKVINARWYVSDSESSVGNCQWAVGTIPQRADTIPFQDAGTPASPGNYSVSVDVTSATSTLPFPFTLHVIVRCYNGAGLPVRAATDGVIVLDGAQSQQMPALRILPDSLTQYPVLDTCHVYRDRLRVRWGSVTSQIPIAGFEIVTSNGSGQDSFRTPPLPFLLDAADLNLTQVPLTSLSSYDVTVHPVDIFGTVNSGVSHTTDVLPAAPVVDANKRVTSSINGTDMTLSWHGLFTSASTLYYEVTAGSVTGAGDIMLEQQTHNTNAVISLAHLRIRAFNMNLVVTAIDSCGQFVTYTQSLDVTA